MYRVVALSAEGIGKSGKEGLFRFLHLVYCFLVLFNLYSLLFHHHRVLSLTQILHLFLIEFVGIGIAHCLHQQKGVLAFQFHEIFQGVDACGVAVVAQGFFQRVGDGECAFHGVVEFR